VPDLVPALQVDRRRAAVAVGVAGALTLVAAATGDWWLQTAPGAGHNLLVARVLLFGVVAGLVYHAPAALRTSSRVGRWAFAGWTAYLLLWLVGLWPGIVMTDGADAVVKARAGTVYEWYSYLHSLLHLALLDVVPHVAAVGVVQVVLTAGVLAYATALAYRLTGSRAAVALITVVAACSAPVLLNTVMYTRDTLFAVLQVLLALHVARVVAVQRAITPAALVGVALLTAVLTRYRGDGVALAIVVPAVLAIGLRPARAAALRAAAVFVAALVLVHVVLPAVLVVDEDRLPAVASPAVPAEHPHAYALSLRLNPLGAVLRSDFFSESREADLAALGRVVDLAKVRELATPTEVPVLWGGHWNPRASPADWDRFFAVADRLLRDNAAIVIGNRIATFANATALTGPGGFTGAHLLTQSAAARDDWWFWPRRGMEGEPPVLRLYDVQSDLLRASGEYRGLTLSGSALHWNVVPWLVLLVGVLVLWRRLPFEAAVSAVLLCRLPLLLLAAPASQYKYLYAYTLGGIVVAGFVLGRAVTDPRVQARASEAPAWARRRVRAGRSDAVRALTRLGLAPGRAAAAGTAAAAVTIAAWSTGGGWWDPRGPDLAQNLTVARVVLFAAVATLAYAVPPLIARSSRTARLAFAGWTLYLGFWLVGQWPGIVEPDTIDQVVQVRSGVADTWYSYVQALLTFMVFDVVPHIAALGVLQVLVMASVLAFASSVVARRARSRVPLAVMTIVCAVSAPLVASTVHYTRDTLFAAGLVTLALLVGLAAEDRTLSRRRAVGIVVLAGLLAAYRADGIVVAVTATVVLLVALRPGRRAALAGVGAMAAALVISLVMLPAAMALTKRERAYAFTLYINPLGAVLQSRFASEDPRRDLADLGRVIDVRRVRELQTPTDIQAYWQNAWRPDASEEDWQRFRRAAHRLLLGNLGAVAGNRLTVFLAASGLRPGGWRGGLEYVTDDAAERVRTVRPLEPEVLRALTATPPVLRLYTAQEDVLHATARAPGRSPTGAMLHWNLLPALLVLAAGVLSLVRGHRLAGAAALVVLCRVPLVFATAPIPQFKYYTGVYLGALVVLGLLLARPSRREPEPPPQRATTSAEDARERVRARA